MLSKILKYPATAKFTSGASYLYFFWSRGLLADKQVTNEMKWSDSTPYGDAPFE